jgi:diguanylate cyclase (GGDEF)-like protein
VSARDPLTDLPGRRSFFLALELEATESQAPGKPLSVLVVDVDGFEALMDAHGPDAGNRALITVAKLLRLATGPGEVLARIKDDQFGIMLAATDIASAHERGDALRRAIEAHFADQPSALTASVGVASGATLGEWTGEEMLALAARRCREAKASGRNRIQAFGHPGMPVGERKRWPSFGRSGKPGDDDDASPQSLQLALF